MVGYLGQMDDGCTPKQLLFGELLRRQPFHGVKKRWCDEVTGDLHAISVGGGFSYARIISSGQRYAPVLLTFLYKHHKVEGQVLVLLTFYQLKNFSV